MLLSPSLILPPLFSSGHPSLSLLLPHMDDNSHRSSDEKQLLLSTTTAAAAAATSNSLKDDHRKKHQQLSPKRVSNKDRHTKVDGRSRRIRMPALCAARVFQLTRELGHKTDGETIQWLLQQSKPAIIAATGTGTIPASFLTSAASSVSSQQDTSVSLKINDTRANNWANFGDNLARSQVPTSIWPSIGGAYTPVFDTSSNNTASLGAQNPSYVTNFQLQGVGLPIANMGLLSFSPILTRGAQIPGLQLGLSQDGHGDVARIYQQQQEQQQQHQQEEHEQDDDTDGGGGGSEAVHQHQQQQQL